MRMRHLWLILLLLLLALPIGCTDEESDEEDAGDDSVKINLRVDSDEVFGFVQETIIGIAKFSDTEGIVGVRIKCVVTLDNYTRFQDKPLAGKLELINTDAIKDDQYIVEFVVDEKESDFEFYIPQINAVPIFLNFDLSLFFEEEDINGVVDQFQASLVYEFDVNRGRPAT